MTNTTPTQLKVLIVDDTRTSRQLLTYLLNAVPDIRVIGEAHDGITGTKLAQSLRPDVIVMDIVMPEQDGLEATRRIMASQPTPIVLVSASLETQETDIAFRALRAGALTVLSKPAGLQDTLQIQALYSAVRAMAGVKVIRHWQPVATTIAATTPTTPLAELPGVLPEIIAIGSSTGGPAALSDILRGLPRDFATPVVIVQHIAPDFVTSLIDWLQSLTPLQVRLAEERVIPQPGYVYVAPAWAHLRLTRQERFVWDREIGASPYMPSVDVLLHSITQNYGNRALGVVLTGMGDDGARGLLALRQAGGITIAQDEATSVVYGMPAEAARLGAAQWILPLNHIATSLIRLCALQEV